jgi:hypothetical protein
VPCPEALKNVQDLGRSRAELRELQLGLNESELDYKLDSLQDGAGLLFLDSRALFNVASSLNFWNYFS